MALPLALFPIAKASIPFVGDFLRRLIGRQPRGDFQKFGRVILPVLTGYAQRENKSAFAFWFGDLIRVRPDGTFSVERRTGTLAEAERFLVELENREQFLWLVCPSPTPNLQSPEIVAEHCQVFQRGSAPVLGIVPRKILTPILAAGAGIAGVLFLRRIL